MAAPRPETTDETALRGLVLALVGVFVFRSAWVGDDAYVTLRTIDHFLHDYGLVYNVGERAQGYTHPLWMLLLLPFYALIGNPWWTAVVVGLGTTLLAVGRAARLVPVALLAVVPLSRAFVDYGTSGLENPLSHLLLVGLAAAWLQTKDVAVRLSRVALFTALLALTRLDLLALAGPALLAAAWSARWDLSPREIARRVAVGLSPLVAWEAFALVYYGSLLPTSALAKLHTALPAGTLAKQGLIYVLYQAEWDPVTLLVLLAGTAVPFATGDRAGRALAVGNALYLAYVVRVGGDFMAGRFLTAPFLLGLVLLARAPLSGPRAWALLGVLLAVSVATPASPLRHEAGVAYGRLNDRGVVDERLYYAARGASIGDVRNHTDDPPQDWRGWAAKEPPTHVQVDEPVGYPAFYAHPEVHWVCRYGITDPLLARLPPFRQIRWRPGHYDRVIPDGYVRTLGTGKNVIADPQVARLYDALQVVNEAALFSPRRLATIWGLHTGAYAVDPGPWRYPDAVEIPDAPPPFGDDRLEAPGAFEVGASGAVRRFPGGEHARALDLRRREDVPWEVVFERDGRELAVVPVPDRPPRDRRLGWTRVEVPPTVARQGYDAVRVLPTRGEPPFVIHHLGPAAR